MFLWLLLEASMLREGLAGGARRSPVTEASYSKSYRSSS